MREGTVHRLFKLGVVVKGVDGILELLGGAIFLLTDPQTLGVLVRFLTAHELSEDPSDIFANALRAGIGHLTADTQLFASAYLLGHGALKLVIAAGLLRDRRWAYPTALWFLGVFAAYELYRFRLTGTPGLLALTVLDLVVMLLVWRELRQRKARPVAARAADFPPPR